MNKISVFIIGSRGYSANYGGWEAFVHGLVDNWSDPSVEFFVFELAADRKEEGIKAEKNAACIRVYVSNTGSSTMMRYDAKCTSYALRYISENHVEKPVLLYLGMRIAPLVWLKKPFMKRKGIAVVANPDGMEWKRTKWNPFVQAYLWVAAHFCALAADRMVCDSDEIRKIYDRMCGAKRIPKEYIPYGADPETAAGGPEPEKVKEFLNAWGIRRDGYYLILGRYTPENNYEMMFKGFMMSGTKRDLLVITNFREERLSFHQHIRESTQYEKDARVKMAGTVYDRELVRYLRRYARAYIHGHSVGGTNPGLLEAMSATDVCLLYDGKCNREAGGDAALYFENAEQLAERIEESDRFPEKTIREYGNCAKERMRKLYSWESAVQRYDVLFHGLFR